MIVTVVFGTSESFKPNILSIGGLLFQFCWSVVRGVCLCLSSPISLDPCSLRKFILIHIIRIRKVSFFQYH
ncbi:hypothetical protein RIF29_06025 [Crotalaria pallida]|uniref:Uncharacterized protein n=1 Tax=Crotalaria pallida TaxID=3830 RepID=A0AAN9J3S2_CROPI